MSAPNSPISVHGPGVQFLLSSRVALRSSSYAHKVGEGRFVISSPTYKGEPRLDSQEVCSLTGPGYYGEKPKRHVKIGATSLSSLLSRGSPMEVQSTYGIPRSSSCDHASSYSAKSSYLDVGPRTLHPYSYMPFQTASLSCPEIQSHRSHLR